MDSKVLEGQRGWFKSWVSPLSAPVYLGKTEGLSSPTFHYEGLRQRAECGQLTKAVAARSTSLLKARDENTP